MSHLCCVSLTLATRIIATFGLSTTVLMLNVLGSKFFGRANNEEFIMEDVKTWSFLGINWILLINATNKEALVVMVCVIIYAVLSLFANVSLAFGSTMKKPGFFLPWIYFQMFSIIDQALAITLRLVYNYHKETQNEAAMHIPLSSFHLLISTYFWMVVCRARTEWQDNPPSYDDIFSVTSVVSNDCNLPKSPSFLAATSQSQFESPKTALECNNTIKSPLPPKYPIV